MHPSVLLFAVAGCSSDPSVAFVRIAELPARTEGIVLQDGSDIADAAMADQVCVVDVRTGAVLGDADPAAGPERLLDAVGDRAIAAASDGLHEVRRDGSFEVVATYEAKAARVTDLGLVGLVEHDGACAVVRGESAWAIAGTDCTGDVGFAADRATGTAWIADGDALAVVGADGAFARFDGVGADSVTLDRGTGRAVLSDRGQAWIRGMEPDGSTAWEHWVAGPIGDVATAGDAGVAGVMAEDGVGGTFHLLETVGGDAIGRHPLPEVASVSISDDGGLVALATDDVAYFYEVDLDVRGFELPTTEQAAGLGAWAALASGGAAGGAAGAVIGAGALVVVAD